MKQIRFIYTEKEHKWGVVSRDPDKPQYLIDTNECLIINGEEAVLTDPGGLEIFPAVFSAISSSFNPKQIKMIFSSHQDPDIISSLTLWLEVNPSLKCHLSRLWTTFVPHFGGSNETLIGIPDEGGFLSLGNLKLEMIPAHYLHSSGNFHLYDSRAKIYFSGDVGAALLPDVRDIYVKNFDDHIKYAREFHMRWMGNNDAKLDWCKRVSELDIDMMVPQHGSIYQGKDVDRFINWFSDLRVGLYNIALDEEIIEDQSEKEEFVQESNLSEDMEGTEEFTIENTTAEAEDVTNQITDHSDLKALMEHNPIVEKSSDMNRQPEKKSFFSKIKGIFGFKKS